MLIVKRRGKPGKRGQEIVRDGFSGYFNLAKSVAYRYYRFAFEDWHDREQAAALAAMEALRLLGPDNTMDEVVSMVRYVLYRQAKAYGWRMINYHRSNGRRTAHWGKREIHFTGISQWSRQMCHLPE